MRTKHCIRLENAEQGGKDEENKKCFGMVWVLVEKEDIACLLICCLAGCVSGPDMPLQVIVLYLTCWLPM